MHNLKRVLILSASYGEGHHQASNAIKDAFLSISPESEIRIVDFMHMTHPVLDSVAKYCYLKSIRFVPSLYGLFYRRTSAISPKSPIQKKLNQLGIDELQEYLMDYRPDIVISTFPTPSGVMSVLKEKGLTDIPLATVITDHAVHNQWIHPYTDQYFVGSEHVKQGMVKRGIPEHKIKVTGIPIRNVFSHPIDSAEAKQQLQLRPDLPTLLIMGGAYGVVGDITQICEELFQSETKMQIIVVCGRNEKLKSQIDELAARSVKPVQVYGFVQNVHTLMAASDLMLTKAGGLTISESLAMELPMLLYRPIPGQEKQNADFLVHSNVAVLAKTRRQVFEYLDTLLTGDRKALRTMRNNTRKIKRIDAAQQIVKHVMMLSEDVREAYSYQFQ
jgi:processive 1,2-diacylglycerol beta-glucosyltransferase